MPRRRSGLASRPRPLPAPRQAPPPPVPQGGVARQPGLFGQMATTAAGVAVGSAIGHTIGEAMTGGSAGTEQPSVGDFSQPTAPQQNTSGGVVGGTPCQIELDQFLKCTSSQDDISLCDGFNQIFKDCKLRYGMR